MRWVRREGGVGMWLWWDRGDHFEESLSGMDAIL